MKIFGLLLIFAVAVWFFLSPGEDQTSPGLAAKEEQGPQASSYPTVSGPDRPKASLAARTAPKTDASGNLPMSEGDFIAALRTTNLESVINLNDLVQKLRAQDPMRIAKFFSNRLSAIADSNSAERGRLFQAANALQSDALLPFWQDLAQRKTPAYPNEAALINAPEPSFDSRVVLSEMSMAVRNLGLISFREPAAGEILKDIALKSNSDIHSTVIRQYAYEALKESDQVAGMQIIRGLKKSDPLKMRLISDARNSK